MLFIGALVPLLAYFEKQDIAANDSSFWWAHVLLGLSVTYLAYASIWAFRTLHVGTYHVVHAIDLVSIKKKSGSFKENLAISLLSITRKNQSSINLKVSRLKMTHAFLIRAILAISVLLILRLLHELWSDQGNTILLTMSSWISSICTMSNSTPSLE